METRKEKIAPALVEFRRRVHTSSVSSQTFWDVCRLPLYECGLALSQTTKLKGGLAYITTSLEHDSGQTIENRTSVQLAADGRIGPSIEVLAFRNLIGILGFVPPNTHEDRAFSLVVDNDA